MKKNIVMTGFAVFCSTLVVAQTESESTDPQTRLIVGYSIISTR
jgi:hypothetical protein